MMMAGPKTAPPAPPKAAPRMQTTGAQTASTPLTLGRMEAVFQPPRIVLNAGEGFGKTSLAAFAPSPAILMAKGETGYATLLGAGLVPQVDAAYAESWPGLLELLDRMAQQETLPYKTLALDATGGFERLCHEHVCARDFDGEWGEKGFSGFQRGYDVAITDWLQLLQRLDAVRTRHGVTILLLGHVQIRPFKNPLGPDFDRYVSDLHHKTWAVTSRWTDTVLFGSFVTIVQEKKGGRPKGIGGSDRVLYCERCDAYDAKNRYGLPEEIDMPKTPAEMWPTLWNALTHKES